MDRQDGPGEEIALSILSQSSKPVQFEALEKLYTCAYTSILSISFIFLSFDNGPISSACT